MIEIKKRCIVRQDYILSAVKGKRVLDIGCVAKDQLLELHRQIKHQASECIGMDIIPAEGVVQGDAQNFDFDQPFDVIVVGEVIEHLGDVRGLISSAERNLVAGGRLIVTTPNAFSFIMLAHACLGKVVPNDAYHVCLFDVTTLRNMFYNYSSKSVAGKIWFYEESDIESYQYKMNRVISKVLPAMASGILLDLTFSAD